MNPVAFLPHLVRISAQAGILVLIILLAQWLFRRQLSPRWRCALWLLLVARLLLPLLPASPTSLFNLVPASATLTAFSSSSQPSLSPPIEPAAPAVEVTNESNALPARSVSSVSLREAPAPAAAEPAPIVALETLQPPAFAPRLPSAPAEIIPAARNLPSWLEIASRVWLAGVVGMVVLLVASTLRLNRRLRRSRPLQDAAVQALLDECRRELGVRACPTLVESEAIGSPALTGVFRPRLVLPSGFTSHFSRAQLRLVFCHELAHLRRRDLLLNWLVAGLQTLHWFNPLVWIGFSRWRADRELACDAIVLEAVGADHNQEYGATILRLLENFTRRAPLPGLVGILESRSRLRRRLEMIAQFRPRARWSLGSAALLAAIAALCLTEARSVVMPLSPPHDTRAISAKPKPALPPSQSVEVALSSPPAGSPARSTASTDETPRSVTPPSTASRAESPARSDVNASPTPAMVAQAVPTPASSPIALPEPAAAPSVPPAVEAAPAPEPAPAHEAPPAPEPVRPAMTPPPSTPLPTFFVVGDSFAADLHEAGDGWGSALVRYVNPTQVRIRNASLAGVSSRTYRTLGHWDKLLAQVHAGDIVFLQFNENETQPLTSPSSIGTLSGAGEEIREIAPADGRRETVHTQGWYLRSYIQDVRSKGATPMLLTSTPKNAWTSYEQVGRGHWKEAPTANGSPEDKITSAVGQEQKVPVIDLARLGYLHYRLLGRELVSRLFDQDGGHLNRYGADLDAYLLVSGLKGIPDLAARGIWSTEGALVIPATTEVNIPILTDWYDTDPPLPVGATGPSSHVILTTVNPGPDFAALYGDGQFSEGNTQPANADLPSIFMIGDEAVRGGRGIGAGNQWGWGDLVGRYLDPTKVNLVVRGVAGSSSRNFITQGTWLALRRKIQRRDFVLIEFGHYEATPIEDPTGRGTLPGAGRESVETTQFPHLGDLDTRNIRRGRETVYTYGAYLRTYVAEVKKSGALPILISPTPRNRWKDGKIVREPELVRQTAEVAKEAGVPFFDLHTLLADRYDAMGQPAAERCFADPEFATHYAGARLAAESIVKLLLVQNPDRIRNFLNPTIAVTSGSAPLEPATVNPARSYWQIRADYRTIDKGMSRADVVARLGAPDRTGQDLSIYWRQGPFSLNRTPYMELDVSYNREDRVAEAKFREGTDRDTLPSPLP